MKKYLVILLLVLSQAVQSQSWWQYCGGGSFGYRMMTSYISINSHATFSQADKDTITSILNTAWVVSTFGPTGQNKTVCDFFMYFKNTNTTTALTTRTNTKSGANFIWLFDRVKSWDKITQKNLPADTCKNGWLGLFTTDGWTGLTVFNCYANYFTSTMPSFAACTSLVTFNCQTNSFSGTMPSFAACTSLNGFACYANSFSGTMPSFAACTSLVTFNCYANSFSGTMPSFAACTSLNAFNCHTNSFSGTMPSFAACTSLVTFYCHANSFSGTMPSFAACTSLVTFNCYTNSFSGTTTDFGGNKNTDVRIQTNSFTLNGTSSFAKAAIAFNVSNCYLPTAEVDELLLNMDTWYVDANIMTANCVVTLTGANMGIPTGGANNTNLLSLIAKAAGVTWTILVRTS